MRSQFVRSAMLVVAASLAVLLLPLLAVFSAYAAAEPGQRLVEDFERPAVLTAAVLAVLALAVLAGGLGMLVARRQAVRVTGPMEDLALQAERLGAGDASVAPLATGISEIDRVSAVLAASSQDMRNALAAERDFAADASHQLRTPLAALLLRLEEIAATSDPVAVREEAGIAIDQVERLTGVVEDLMGRAKRRPSEASAVSLDSVIAALQREWQPAFEYGRRSMRVHGERGLQVLIARSALSQILSTLIENSLTHGRGTVSVLARRSGATVVVEVSDEGHGVPAELAPHIFERSVSSRGGGLGLTLARDLAEKNYGRLELLRAAPAVFALFLSDAGSSSLANTNVR